MKDDSKQRQIMGQNVFKRITKLINKMDLYHQTAH